MRRRELLSGAFGSLGAAMLGDAAQADNHDENMKHVEPRQIWWDYDRLVVVLTVFGESHCLREDELDALQIRKYLPEMCDVRSYRPDAQADCREWISFRFREDFAAMQLLGTLDKVRRFDDAVSRASKRTGEPWDTVDHRYHEACDDQFTVLSGSMTYEARRLSDGTYQIGGERDPTC